MKNDFVYTTYIHSTPAKVWQAITNPEFTRQYWGHAIVSDWKPGSEWAMIEDSGHEKINKVVGQVLECAPPQRLVLSWADPENPADDSRVTFEIEKAGDLTRLDVVHGAFKDGSSLPERISTGWPRVLSGLKTFLESGTVLDIWAGMGACGCKVAAAR